ncbi:unnamed protein product [Lepeophtheirus salmonis]|uniref:(salmon louse) hypothetical protein n=1 Tax=Lepeophtheirus salmonis TaxID=72036 RepID=A0A7R8D2K6_LEPSM|nr:unnamed protein product [Lepeophtheirus salmonis]CAF3006665.1 unnamed protein product [Lepeophtheirus salmonis]
MWSDSKTALNWIRNDKDSFKVHVQARVSEIQDTFSPELFHFVPGKQNPADALTKHITVNCLKIWHQGPSFPYSKDWPEDPQDIYINVRNDPVIKETKRLGRKCNGNIGIICMDFEEDDSLKTLGVKLEDTLVWKHVLNKVNKEDRKYGSKIEGR